MRIYFVRHGKTEYNKTQRLSGQVDIPLIEEGIQGAEEVISQIPAGISTIYSSDLIRCKQTTDILNKNLNLPVVYDARLRERSFGSLEGAHWSVIDPDGALKAKDHSQQYDYRSFQGESVEDVKKRVFACIEDIRRQEKDGTALVVTSAGVIRLLHHVLNDEIHEVVHNSSIHEFEFAD